MDKLMAQFIEEARELIGRAGQGLLKLEKHPDDAELIDGIFRDVHTLKGSGGVLELAPLVRVLHRGEELLEHARTEPDYLTADCVDALLDALDQVGVWIDDLDSRESLPESAAEQAKDLDERLVGFLGERNATPAADSAPLDGEGTRWGLFDDALPTAATASATTTADWLPSLSPQQAMNCWRALSPEQPLYAVEFRPDAGCFFRGDDPVLMAASAPGLALLNFELDAVDEALENLDVYQCRLRLGLICQASAEAIETHFQYEADTVSLTPLVPETLIQPSGQIEDALPEEHLNKLNELWSQGQQNLLLKELDSLFKEVDAEGRNASLLSWMRCLVETRPDDALVFDTLLQALQSPQTILDSQGRIDWATALAQSEAVPAQPASPSPQPGEPSAAAVMLDPDSAAVGTVLADQQQLMQLCQDDALRPGSFDAAQRVLSNTARALDAQLPTPVVEAGNADVLQNALDDWLSDPVDSVAAATPVEKTPGAPSSSITAPPTSAVNTAATAITQTQPKAQPPEPAAPLERDSVAPVIRNFKVDQEEVENLGDLVGELVVAKNALPFLAQRAEQVFGQRQLGREIREQFNVINRITRSLQDAMMAVQMLPVSYVFDRFPRLVRDLSRKLGKSIELTVIGDDTEAEKHVIESLADPLVHLMRNSIDHGIESPQQRQAAGKPQTGQIRLEARQQNEWVVIEVADDGAGIDPQMTRKRAYEKGLVDERRLQEMTDEDAIDLIFTPGFSTLDEASELSGRGVGMDVVRTTVEKAGGRLDIDSQIGKGTTFRMQLPLSMSVSQVMQIWIGGQRYGVPIDQVAETVRLPVDRLHRFKGRETILLRERVVPVSRAREQLGLEAAEEGDSIALLVVRQRGELVALMVDEFSEGVEVILKPMEGALENLGVYQGTALLGDGSVLLVLNVGVLLSNAVLEESVDEH